jgi:predicted secreted protein
MSEAVDTDAVRRDVDKGHFWGFEDTLSELLDEIDRLRAVTTDTNDAAWREVAIALASELADTGIDPRSYALLAYNHARNGRMDEAVEAARTAYSKDGEHG